MHYERAPCLRRSKLDVAPPPLRCAEASLRQRWEGMVCRARDVPEVIRKEFALRTQGG